MKLRCGDCKNKKTFMATAKANINVLVDGSGHIIDPRASEQMLDDVEVVKPWKCNSCGSTNIKDTQTEEKNVSNS